MTANDPERLVLVLRMAKKMRKLQKQYINQRRVDMDGFDALCKAEREFDIAVGALKL